METTCSSDAGGSEEKGQFPNTKAHLLTISQAAATDSSPDAREAFGRIYETYKPALIAYLWASRSGTSHEQIEDLLADFFAKLLSNKSLSSYDKGRGKFRTWLLRCLKHSVADKWNFDHAEKRNSGGNLVSIGDSSDPDCVQPAANTLSADQAYDRQFATEFLRKVLQHLEDTYTSRNKKLLFDSLVPFLGGKNPESTLAEAGRELGMSEHAVTKEVSRMRERYRELFQAELTALCGAQHCEEETRHLFAALAQAPNA